MFRFADPTERTALLRKDKHEISSRQRIHPLLFFRLCPHRNRTEPRRHTAHTRGTHCPPGKFTEYKLHQELRGSRTVAPIGGQLTDSIKEGYRYRDANGKLLESVPDTVLSPAEVEALLPTFRDVYLFQILSETQPDGRVLLELGIEFPQAEEFDTLVTPSYRIGVRCEKAVFGWDYYMNRVES